MTLQLSYIESNSTSPQYNLAMEEYLLLHCFFDECILYLWQNEHTVVIGKNQNAWKECNISKLEEENGTLVRRLSGGGCVYHDLGNLNFTFICRKDNYDVQKQSEVILKAVQKLGISAEKSGRNDLLVNGKKFSGHAYYKQKDFCYHHGTIMFDVNKETLGKYLNVSKAKLQAKGVDSVRSRVCNLKEFNKEITISLLKEKLQEAFCEVYGSTFTTKELNDAQKNEIEQLRSKYTSWEWTYGRNMNFTHQYQTRFDWGELMLSFVVEKGIIQDLEVYSDAMFVDISQEIKAVLCACRYDKEEICKRLWTCRLNKEYIEQICGWINSIEL